MDQLLSALARITRPFYRVRGLARLADMARRAFARPGREVLATGLRGGVSMYVDLGEHIGSWIFWKGSHSGDELDYIGKWLKPGAVFFDAGANQGEFSLFAAARGARVYAFEPVPAIRARLERNISLNGFSGVKVLPYGLGSSPGTLSIALPDESGEDGTVNMGVPSLYGSGSRSERVEIRTLDAVFEELGPGGLDVLKMDVEGAEAEILKGGMATLARYRPVIMVEMNDAMLRKAGSSAEDLRARLEALGYSLVEIVPGREARPLAAGDFAFKNVACLPR